MTDKGGIKLEQELINAGLAVLGGAVVILGTKLGKAGPLIKKAYHLIQEQAAARKDGKLTQLEKAKLYDDIEAVILEVNLILSGLLPNRG